MNIGSGVTKASPVGVPDPKSLTLIAGYGLAIARALEARGIDPQRIFEKAGIDRGLTNDPLKRLSLPAVSALYRSCVEATADEYFGLSVANFIRASTMHALGHGLLASTTLMDFCLRVQRYFGLVSQSSVAGLEVNDGTVRLSFEPRVDVSMQSEDAWIGSLYLTMRTLYRETFHPLAVEFAHTMPNGGAARYVDFFGAPVHFDSGAGTLVLARADMDVPLYGACPEIAQWNDNLAANYIARLDRADIVANVRARIVELLPNGTCSKRRVAADLHMSATTLQQRLTERATSFHQLLSEIRGELASSYLRQSGTSVTEIAFVLGFTDVSNFTRAFKRWTGMSPTRFRAGADRAPA